MLAKRCWKIFFQNDCPANDTSTNVSFMEFCLGQCARAMAGYFLAVVTIPRTTVDNIVKLDRLHK